MFSSSQLAGFAVAALIVMVIPGPSVLFVVGRALALGRRMAIASVVGGAVGEYVVVALVAFGLGTVLQRSEIVFTAVKLVGCAYLIWLGIKAIRHRTALGQALTASSAPVTTRRAAGEAFLVGVSNPKAFILFAGILPQFVDRTGGHVPVQMLLLGLVAVGIALVSDTIWALAASAVRSWFGNSPRRLGMVGGFGGLAMIGVGVTVAVTGRSD